MGLGALKKFENKLMIGAPTMTHISRKLTKTTLTGKQIYTRKKIIKTYMYMRIRHLQQSTSKGRTQDTTSSDTASLYAPPAGALQYYKTFIYTQKKRTSGASYSLFNWAWFLYCKNILFFKSFLNLLRVLLSLISLSRSFHNLIPVQRKEFWLIVVLGRNWWRSACWRVKYEW